MSRARDYSRQYRNTYGEAPHAARKSIPRGKRRQNQKERRKVRAVLASSNTEHIADISRHVRRRNPFRKVPDEPLGRVLIARGIRQLVLGRIAPEVFRSRMVALWRSYPAFTPDYHAVYRRLRVDLSPPIAALLAEFA